MLPDFISITSLQREAKKVFDSDHPIRIVLSKNAVVGLVFSKEAAELLMESDVLQQIREELWELNDPETQRVIAQSRSGKGDRVPFEQTLPGKKYGKPKKRLAK